jgi:hypothetical protein
VPDNFSAPNAFPPDFFNVNSPRGVVVSTPGTGFQTSADNSNPTATPIEFANIDPNYSAIFATFSPQRLFTSIGSNAMDVSFFVPGSSTPALTRGFGSVFTDVDFADTTSLSFFDLSNNLLGTYSVPNVGGNEVPANETFSFLGVSYADPIVSRVRIVMGDRILAPGTTAADLVVADDFLYGEPVPVPEPSTYLALAVGLAVLAGRRLAAARRT